MNVEFAMFLYGAHLKCICYCFTVNSSPLMCIEWKKYSRENYSCYGFSLDFSWS